MLDQHPHKIVVFVDRQGTCTARTTRPYNHDAWQVELYNLKTKGFSILDSFTVPARAMRNGWVPFYQAYLRWAIHNLGI